MLQHSKSLFFAQVYIAPPPAWVFLHLLLHINTHKGCNHTSFSVLKSNMSQSCQQLLLSAGIQYQKLMCEYEREMRGFVTFLEKRR